MVHAYYRTPWRHHLRENHFHRPLWYGHCLKFDDVKVIFLLFVSHALFLSHGTLLLSPAEYGWFGTCGRLRLTFSYAETNENDEILNPRIPCCSTSNAGAWESNSRNKENCTSSTREKTSSRRKRRMNLLDVKCVLFKIRLSHSHTCVIFCFLFATQAMDDNTDGTEQIENWIID